MKIKDLQMHCGNCSLVEMCGSPFEFSVCTVTDVHELDETEYMELYTKAESLVETDMTEYDDALGDTDSDFANEHHETVCKKIIELKNERRRKTDVQ